MGRSVALILVVTGWLAFAGCSQVEYRREAGLDIERLHNAILTDDVGYLRSAIQSGAVNANARIPAPVYMEGAPLLAIAARAASLGVMRYLIAAGADLNARTPAGETALMLAAYFFREDRERGGRSYDQHEKAVRLLVQAGADVENHPHHYTPLSYAAYQGHDHIVRFLIERGARVNADAQNGATYINTPLMMAAIQGHRAAAMALLRAGADARIRVRGGLTAAEFARKYNNTHMLHLLQCAERLAPGETFDGKCRADAMLAAREN